MAGDIGQQGDVSGALDGPGYNTLVFGAGTGLATGQHAPCAGHAHPERFNVFVIDYLHLVDAKVADLGAPTAATLIGPTAATTIIIASPRPLGRCGTRSAVPLLGQLYRLHIWA